MVIGALGESRESEKLADDSYKVREGTYVRGGQSSHAIFHRSYAGAPCSDESRRSL